MKKPKNISTIFEAKLIEHEYENVPYTLSITKEGQVIASSQPLIEELKAISKKLDAIDIQGRQLVKKLFFLKKNHIDGMQIIDETYNGLDGEVFPWKSPNSHSRNNYVSWDIVIDNLNLVPQPILFEIAIHKRASNQDQIEIVDKMVNRLLKLNEMASELLYREREITVELSDKFGGPREPHPDTY